MIKELINIPTTKKDLQRFGITLGLVLFLWGALFLWHKKDFYFWFFLLAPVCLLFSILTPVVFKPVYLVLNILFRIISLIITYIILGFIFYLVITPIGLLLRLLGKGLLDTGFNKDLDSFWIKRNQAPADKSKYEAQF